MGQVDERRAAGTDEGEGAAKYLRIAASRGEPHSALDAGVSRRRKPVGSNLARLQPWRRDRPECWLFSGWVFATEAARPTDARGDGRAFRRLRRFRLSDFMTSGTRRPR
jgi:hypothetical protein